MQENQNYSAAQAKRLSLEHGKGMPFLSGENSETTRDRAVSTVQSSEMSRPTKVLSLSDRLTPSLLRSGLVKGIIPMSMRRKLSLTMQDIVSNSLDGIPAD